MTGNVTAVRIDLEANRKPIESDPMGMRPMQRRVFDKRSAIPTYKVTSCFW